MLICLERGRQRVRKEGRHATTTTTKTLTSHSATPLRPCGCQGIEFAHPFSVLWPCEVWLAKDRGLVILGGLHYIDVGTIKGQY